MLLLLRASSYNKAEVVLKTAVRLEDESGGYKGAVAVVFADNNTRRALVVYTTPHQHRTCCAACFRARHAGMPRAGRRRWCCHLGSSSCELVLGACLGSCCECGPDTAKRPSTESKRLRRRCRTFDGCSTKPIRSCFRAKHRCSGSRPDFPNSPESGHGQRYNNPENLFDSRVPAEDADHFADAFV